MREAPGRGRWPAGLLGMLALVIGVERYVARHDAKFTTIAAASWRRSGESVREAARSAVVCLGDSLVKHGVVPPVLAERAGVSAYNLAVPKGQAAGSYFLFRRLLDSGARPKALVVDGEKLEADPAGLVRVWPELLGLRDCAELALELRDPGFFGSVVLAELIPSYRARTEIRLSVTKALAGAYPEETQALPVYWRNWRRNGGAQPLPPFDMSKGDPRPKMLEDSGYMPAHWACHPKNAVYVDRLLDLAEARGVPVFWVMPPYHPEVQARREKFGLNAYYRFFLNRLLERHPNLTVVDGRTAEYPADVLADMTHLDRVGAVTFTEALGGVIRDRLAPGADAPRWVVLPKYREGAWKDLASAWAVEDTYQSGKELNRVMAEVRNRREEKASLASPADEDRRRR